MAEVNQKKSIGFLKIIIGSLKLFMAPQKIYVGVKQIFNEGGLNHKVAIVFALMADLISLFRVLAVFLSLGSLIAISEFFEFVITCITTFVLGLLLQVNISFKGYMVELVPYLDVLPTFTLMVLAQFEKDKVEGKLNGNTGTYSGLTSGTDSYSFILIFVLMVGAFLGLGILISIFLPNVGGFGLGNLPGQAFNQAGEAIQEAPTLMAKISIWFSTLYQAPFKWWDRQYAIATGGYYQGQVDQYADKDLGVFIENVEAAEEKFYLGSEIPIQVFAELRAETLETDDCEKYLTANENSALFKDLNLPIEEQIKYYQDQLYKNKEDCKSQQTVKLECGLSGKKVNGTMKPSTSNLFDLQGGASAIDCEIPKTKLSDGTEIVDIKAIFPFVTKSYVKTYFMDTNRLRDMKRQKVDPLEFYQIKDKKPEPTYTGGPIMIGIGLVADLPITIDVMSDEQRSVRLGITLENKWTGKISEITELKIIVPEELRFVHPLFQTLESEPGAYVLSELGKKQILAEKGIETLKTYNGRIEARDAESARALLNNIPLVTKYIKVTARYNYEIKESTVLRLEKDDGFKTSLSNCNEQCVDYDGCYCDMECEGTSQSSYGIVSGAGVTGNYVTPLEVTRGYNCNSEYKEIPVISSTTTTTTSTSTITTNPITNVVDSSDSITALTVTESQVINYVSSKASDILKNEGLTFYNSGVLNGIDPAFGIAIARQESSLGKAGGLAGNCNNFFGLTYNAVKQYGATECSYFGIESKYLNSDGTPRFASFSSAKQGVEVFFKYFKNQYLSRGQNSVPKLVAPLDQGAGDYYCRQPDKRCYCCDTTRGYESWLNSVPMYRIDVKS